MALIKCEECGKEVSDKASACPHCGIRLSVPVTVEQTAKKWKRLGLQAYFLMVLGLIIFLAGVLPRGDWGVASIVGLAIAVIGILSILVVSFLAWWHHG